MKANMVKEIGASVTRVLGRSGLVLKKHSPEILFVAGMGLLAAGTIKACKDTWKADDIVSELKVDISEYEIQNEGKEDDPEVKKEIRKKYMKAGKEIAKVYIAPASMWLAGAGCLCGSFGILRGRYALMSAAYSAMEQGFEAYRERVREELGDEQEKMFYHGVKKKKVVEEVDGEEKEIDEVSVEQEHHSPYAKIFDPTSRYWEKIPEYNLTFLQDKQREANLKLFRRGHLFLNEVYDMLDIPRTPQGAICGWLKDGDNSDGYVDFGIYDVVDDPSRVRFINGLEPCIWLDFNVDGVIYDMIG